ncbi:uncharacterized protein LOC100902038 [Galendromus occidentalis]|uniref:Uncharacterized protein LOC100902038 n=1 Tax=Galendromus occidentalis TaxID=34638 RepID=A0AAJ6QXV8_9ACAR|nr:uncharacterized protein LOC100902038 [Galendromus occidentalis]
MYYSFASPFADLGNAGVTRSPARPTESASTFPLDLSSKTPPLARDLFDQQRAALAAASMLSSRAFSEWCPSIMGGCGGGAASPVIPSSESSSSSSLSSSLPSSLKGFAESKSPPLALPPQSSAFLEKQKQLAALMFSCHAALMDPVAMFRAQSLQHAFASQGPQFGPAPPVFPAFDASMWTARGFDASSRSDEATTNTQIPTNQQQHQQQQSSNGQQQPPNLTQQEQQHQNLNQQAQIVQQEQQCQKEQQQQQQQHQLIQNPPQQHQQQQQQLLQPKAPLTSIKTEKTFQPWKDDVVKPKKTPFNIEALSKPDDNTSTTTPNGPAVKDDAVKVEFKYSLHPKKRRLASPETCVDTCGTSSAVLKPKKRLVQVLQKWDEASAASALVGTSMSTSPTIASLASSAVSDQEQQESLLHRAARTGNLEMVNFCLERCGEVDINQKGRSNTTALHEAAANGFVTIARVLLEKGAHTESETVTGLRPIHEAAAKGHTEVVRLLLSFGAEANAKTYSGETSANIAGMLDFKIIKQLLEEFCEDNSFVDEQGAIDNNIPSKRRPWTFFGNATCIDRCHAEAGFDVLQGAPDFSLVPEIAIRTFRVLRHLDDGSLQTLTCAHLDELIASTGLTDVGVFLRTIGDEISNQIVFNVDKSMESDAFSKYYPHLANVRAIRWDEESKRLLSQALSRGQETVQAGPSTPPQAPPPT